MKIILLFTGLFSLSRRLVLHLLDTLAQHGRDGDGVAGELLHSLALHGRAGVHGGGDDSVVCTSGGVAGRKLLVPLLGLLLVVQEPPHSRICLENSWELFWLLWAARLVIFLVL